MTRSQLFRDLLAPSLETFINQHERTQDAVTEVLVDLLHWCDTDGVQFARCFHNALAMFSVERATDAADPQEEH